MTSQTQSVEDLCNQAKSCLKQRDARGAITAYQQAAALNPDHIAAHEGVARVAFMVQDYDLAIQHFKRVAALCPKSIDPLINLGAVYNRKGDYKEAIKVLRQALARDRRSAEAYYNLGIAERGANQLSMAVSAYKEAIRLCPGMYEAHSNLGNALIEMKSYGQASRSFEKALELKPDFEKARRGLQKVRDLQSAAKNSSQPFGRLVDVVEVQKRNAAGEVKFRALTPQERYEDREAVQRLAKEVEQGANALMHQLRDELSPTVLEMTRIVTEQHELGEWSEEADVLHAAIQRARQCAELVFHKMDELRAHEATIRG